MPDAPWQAACGIVRWVEAIAPLYSSEFNDKIPAYYPDIRSFEANPQNNYSQLDSTLHVLPERAVVDLTGEPADITSERSRHTRYLADLQSINRDWESDPAGDLRGTDYWGTESVPFRPRVPRLTPLRLKDPIADNLLREQSRFHASLYNPHLLFQLRVFAESEPVARLLASVVAQSAFTKGVYKIFTCRRGEPYFARIVHSLQAGTVAVFPDSEAFFPGQDPALYSGLVRLAHLATVDELAGALRLPAASFDSPCCIRKNTDPRFCPENQMFLLGYDDEPVSGGNGCSPRGLPRGISPDRLVKHLFVSGVTGSGKTSAVSALLVQLHKGMREKGKEEKELTP